VETLRLTYVQTPDEVLVKITDYVLNKEINSSEAFSTARYCLMDTFRCGLLALTFF
jgi:Uncharacterized protein involved in propionate catabolism